jgi:hypothetical protein
MRNECLADIRYISDLKKLFNYAQKIDPKGEKMNDLDRKIVFGEISSYLANMISSDLRYANKMSEYLLVRKNIEFAAELFTADQKKHLLDNLYQIINQHIASELNGANTDMQRESVMGQLTQFENYEQRLIAAEKNLGILDKMDRPERTH